MKELIEKYKNRIDFLQRNRSFEVLGHIDFIAQREVKVLLDTISDLESLQSKGKTPTNEDIACEILARFHYTPHPNQRDKYNREKKAFADGAMWVREEYAQSHANKDGWVRVEDAQRLLAIRDALIQDDIELAYHELRMLADPNTERNNHWENWEKIATKPQI